MIWGEMFGNGRKIGPRHILGIPVPKPTIIQGDTRSYEVGLGWTVPFIGVESVPLPLTEVILNQKPKIEVLVFGAPSLVDLGVE